MTHPTNEHCYIRSGYDAVDLIREAGELIIWVLAPTPPTLHPAAYLSFITEQVDISGCLIDRRDPLTIKKWIEPKRDAINAELTKRHLHQTPEARLAMRKIDATLDWIDSWTHNASR